MVTFDKGRFCEVTRRHLEEEFPLFDDAHSVDAVRISDGKSWIGYRTVKGIPRGSTHFDLNIEGDICHLLFVEVEKTERGRENGRALYSVIERVAKELECGRVRQTPSGWTPDGKSRKEYLKGLGYAEVDGSEEVEKVLSQSSP